MKILVVSDTHLGTLEDPKKFNFLKKIVSAADRVIINGDFWEGYKVRFDDFVGSSWSRLFPLLRQKKAVYIYGNHDKKSYSNDKVSLFCVRQGRSYTLKSGSITFYFEHGDRYAPLGDNFFSRMSPAIMYPLDHVERFLTRAFGTTFQRIFYQHFNEKIKSAIRGKYKKNELFVCGHIPFQEIDEEARFANGGFVKHGLGQYLIIEDGKITAHEEWYL